MKAAKRFLIAAGTALLLLPALAAAGPCDATFNFDGNLADASGNVQEGVMIAAGGKRAKPVFVAGRSGQALSLEGTSAMRAPLDLHFEICPQVTISAWIKRTDASPSVTQYVVSTGSGSGPGIRVSGSGLAINGPANGLFRTNVIRPNAGWQFVAGVYDYTAGTLQMYYGFRGGEAQTMGAVKPGEDALWIGAWNDSLSAPAIGILVDDVQIVGRALSKEQVYALQRQRSARPSGDPFEPAQLPGDQFEPVQLPGDQFEPVQLPGDQFEPVQLPGDQFEPAQLPGDQFEPAQIPGNPQLP